MAARTALVTGGTGFLGKALVARLLADDVHVKVFARNARDGFSGGAVEAIDGDVLDADALREAAAGCELVYHLAGKVEHSRRRGFLPLRALHIDGTVNAIEAASDAGARRVVIASTSGTVGVTADPARVPDDDAPYATHIVDRWPYYLTKIETEHAAFDRAAARRIELVAMRPSLILGPGDDRMSSSRLLEDFRARKIPLVPGGGVSFVDVRDAADMFAAAADRGRPGATYLLGAVNWTFEQLFETLEALTGVPRPRLRAPYPIAKLGSLAAAAAARLRDEPAHGLDPVLVEMTRYFWYCDAVAARADLGFAPRDPEATLTDALSG